MIRNQPPLWRRLWICFTHRKAWMTCRAMNRAHCVLWNQGIDYALAVSIGQTAERLWAELWDGIDSKRCEWPKSPPGPNEVLAARKEALSRELPHVQNQANKLLREIQCAPTNAANHALAIAAAEQAVEAERLAIATRSTRP